MLTCNHVCQVDLSAKEGFFGGEGGARGQSLSPSQKTEMGYHKFHIVETALKEKMVQRIIYFDINNSHLPSPHSTQDIFFNEGLTLYTVNILDCVTQTLDVQPQTD